jgi:hypothetical protein
LIQVCSLVTHQKINNAQPKPCRRIEIFGTAVLQLP